MKQQQFAYFLILTFLLVVAWIGFNIYNDLTTSSITPLLQHEIQPIAGVFDKTAINAIKQRNSVNPEFTVLQPQPSITTESSASGTITITPTPLSENTSSQNPSPVVQASITPTITQIFITPTP